MKTHTDWCAPKKKKKTVKVHYHKNVVSVGNMTTGLEKLHKVVKLAMDITTDGDRTVDRLYIWFLNQNLFHLLNKTPYERYQVYQPLRSLYNRRPINVIYRGEQKIRSKVRIRRGGEARLRRDVGRLWPWISTDLNPWWLGVSLSLSLRI